MITYERNGGALCVDELYAIYPDGRIVADNGTQTVEKKASPADVEALLGSINDLGWFTDNMYSTSEIQCGQCFTYYTAVLQGPGQGRQGRGRRHRPRRPTTGW